MESEIGQFSSKFCQWVQSSRGDKSARDAFPAALRKVIRLELPRRDDQVELVVRELIGSEGLACRSGTETQFMLPNGEEDIQRRLVACGINIIPHDDKPARLLAFTLTPLWRGGFDEILPNRTHYESITDFLWFAGQYVARSRATNLIGAIALTYDRACDFRFGSASFIPYSDIDAKPIMRLMLQSPSVRGRERRLMAWIDALNALDPYIHRMVYHYVRAVALKHAGFAEEAVVSLDRVTSVAGQLILNRFKQAKGHGDNAITILTKYISLTHQDTDILHNLNSLRDTFGAHPSNTKWWDFSEMYGGRSDEVADEVEMFFRAIRHLIWKLASFERRYRAVDQDPAAWSDWFNHNAMMLWNSVWFERLPPLHSII